MVSPLMKDSINKGRDDNKKLMSPFPNQPRFFDSPPAGNRSSTRGTTPSSQRKLFGFEPENIENSKSVLGKKKCRRANKSRTSDVALSDLFSESTSPTINGSSSKSLLLGPRLTRRSQPSLFPTEYSQPLAKKKSGGTIPAPKLAPKISSPPQRSKRLPKLSPRKDPMMLSPLRPPRNPLRSGANSNSNDFNFCDFSTMTPTILYGNGGKEGHYNNHRPMSAGIPQQQHYHQSPYWSGQVRINPFSPVPEQYLHNPPPTSIKSVSRASRKQQRPGFYKWMNLELPPTLPADVEERDGPDQLLVPRKKSRRLDPIAKQFGMSSNFDDDDDLFNKISPTDVAIQASNGLFDTDEMCGNKRKAQDMTKEPQPQSMMDDIDAPWQNNSSNQRMRTKPSCGRYLTDFQEVQFLGAGSFGSVNACLSRLDGCMYAVKSISPTGQVKKGGIENNAAGNSGGQAAFGTMEGGANYLYGGRKMMSNQCGIPPTPRISVPSSPLKRKKAMSRFSLQNSVGSSEASEDDFCGDLGVLEGSSHWNDGALRRMLREVFALAALCQQDDFRTFHIVRYQQAWLEDDGTLYIQTELCSATLLDEMSGKATIPNGASNASSGRTINVSRQLKILREVLLALELVHKSGMVHLDIKPDNIFVKNDMYKLGDFGLANVFTKNEGKGKAATTATATQDIEEGDSRYMSKDLLDFSPKDLTKCDIFSLGATMYEICSGNPLPTCGQEWQDLRNGKLSSPLLPGTMPCITTIIRIMMHPDPEKRPSATELLSRPVLGSEDDNPLLGMMSSRKSSSYKVGTTKVKNARPALKRSASWAL